MRFKLLKPKWAQRLLKNGETNSEFIEEIVGVDGQEGNFSEKYIKEMNEKGFNVYFFPNYPSKMPNNEKYAHGRHIDVFKFVFVDMDLKDGIYPTKEAFYEEIKKFKIKPYMVIDSGNGVHVYWLISDLKKEMFPIVQKLLIQKFDTDKSIWTLKQVMRYPGSFNTKKYKDYKETKIIDSVPNTDEAYSINQLLANLPPITEKIEKKAHNHIAKMDGKIIEVIHEVDFDKLPEKFVKDYYKNGKVKQLFDDPKSYKGDRSSADMKLCNVLFNLNYTKEEALMVIINTEKASERDSNSRMSYANAILDKVYKDRSKYYVPPINELTNKYKILGIPVNGPEFMDCQEYLWETGQVLGLVMGTGIGKTTLTLFMFKEILKNNPTKRAIYFSLEMPKSAIIRRWKTLTKNEPELSSRFHVVDTSTEDNDVRSIGLQEIVWITKDIERATGDKVITIAIDYMAELSTTINLRKKPTFNVEGSKIEDGNKKSYIKNLTYETLVLKVKEIAKITNTFIIIQSQTTAAKDGEGDRPLGKHSAYGTAKFANMVHLMMTAWQPLISVYDETDLRVTTWQYCKVREIGEKDIISVGVPNQLAFDRKTGNYRPLKKEEGREFDVMLNLVYDKKDESNGKPKGPNYKNSPTKEVLMAMKKDFNKRRNNISDISKR